MDADPPQAGGGRATLTPKLLTRRDDLLRVIVDVVGIPHGQSPAGVSSDSGIAHKGYPSTRCFTFRICSFAFCVCWVRDTTLHAERARRRPS